MVSVAVSASVGDTTVVSAVAGKKIRVMEFFLVPTGTATLRFESGTGGTALTGQMSTVTGNPIASGYSPDGHFETGVGELLNIEFVGVGLTISGWLTYVEVD